MRGLKPHLVIRVPVVAFFLLMLSAVISPALSNDIVNDRLIINPEYKVTRMSNGSVIVTSRNPERKEFRQEFSDFYADLLMAAYRKQSVGYITENLKKKYYLSEDECRREIKHAINVLSEWNIISSVNKPTRTVKK